jgi:hypothetical protein
MNSVENLKSTQWRKFFKLFKSSSMQCLNIFGAREGFLFEITSLSGVWKFCKSFNGPGPHVSDPFPFDHTGRSPSPARHPCSQWPRSPHDEHSVSVAAGRHHPRGLPPPPTTAPDVTEEAVTHFAFPLPSFGRATRCSAPHQSLLRPPLPITDELPRAIRPGQKKCLVTAPLLH